MFNSGPTIYDVTILKPALPSPPPGSLATPVAPAAGALLEASSDVEAVLAWLKRTVVNGSSATVDSYKKEAERFLAWLAHHGLGLRDCSIEKSAEYLRFLEDPPAQWIGRRVRRNHPDWGRFAGPLKPASIRQARLVLGSLFSFLTDGGYCAGNPFKLLGRVTPAQRRVHERTLRSDERIAILASIETMPRDGPRDIAHYSRCRWLFLLLVTTGIRRAEAAGGHMADFWRDDDGTRWIKVTGKGQKIRDVPVTDELLQETKAYRTSLGLPPYPSATETTPLVCPVIGRRATMTPKAIYLIMRQILLSAAAHTTPRDPDLAARLREASTHWTRHTAATLKLECGESLEQVQEDLGHASINTTRGYTHINRRTRHERANLVRVTSTPEPTPKE